ncbi:conserved hypothetical protein [Theileria equi strain WA]|uniref:RNAse P Rpr2/Rpp21 subunit domain-containing protein n=1 Tax=Theileria equi strain WA TaxID=1537102 RepID=L1LFC2_THEEQ|nr:conserved hypothetical protein [Theileria equi strain WA]EKX74056.1 conserved hypothetical protein [Theileria equi strain WA]|eukprot:XP_004833508.1 conserved hypothetical protein [Theileria equi strain WA]
MVEGNSKPTNIEEVCSFRTARSKFALENNKHTQRVSFLLKAADLFAKVDPNLSRTYIKELREISEKHLIRLKTTYKRKYCSGCNTVLVPGKTALVQAIDSNNVVLRKKGHKDGNNIPSEKVQNWVCTTCMICTRSRRYPSTS